MLSLRAFARRAPRNAFQIARLSTRPPACPAVQRFLRSNTLLKSRYQPFAAAFSTTSSRFDDRSQELSVRLNHEIGIEEENNNAETASNTNVKSFMDENAAWEFEDNQGEQDVLMKRTYDDEQIVRL
jgi:complement component 1 Q subcomponent-binding protein